LEKGIIKFNEKNISILLIIISIFCVSCSRKEFPKEYWETYDGEKIEFLEDKKELPSKDDAMQITKDMTWTEVTQLIGLPQNSVGSGYIGFQYYLNDGSAVFIYYNNFDSTYTVNEIKFCERQDISNP